MFDLRHQAETVRRRMLQPAADLLVVHAGLNCFQVAAACVVTFVALGVAGNVHQAMVGPWTWWNLVMGVPVVWGLAALARHLLRFQARASRTDFRVVHPWFRLYEATAYMVSCFVPFATAVALTVDWYRHHDVWHLAWAGLDNAGLLVLSVGLQVAGCEWRRLPRARSRSEVEMTGAASRAI